MSKKIITKYELMKKVFVVGSETITEDSELSATEESTMIEALSSLVPDKDNNVCLTATDCLIRDFYYANKKFNVSPPSGYTASRLVPKANVSVTFEDVTDDTTDSKYKITPSLISPYIQFTRNESDDDGEYQYNTIKVSFKLELTRPEDKKVTENPVACTYFMKYKVYMYYNQAEYSMINMEFPLQANFGTNGTVCIDGEKTVSISNYRSTVIGNNNGYVDTFPYVTSAKVQGGVWAIEVKIGATPESRYPDAFDFVRKNKKWKIDVTGNLGTDNRFENSDFFDTKQS